MTSTTCWMEPARWTGRQSVALTLTTGRQARISVRYSESPREGDHLSRLVGRAERPAMGRAVL